MCRSCRKVICRGKPLWDDIVGHNNLPIYFHSISLQSSRFNDFNPSMGPSKDKFYIFIKTKCLLLQTHPWKQERTCFSFHTEPWFREEGFKFSPQNHVWRIWLDQSDAKTQRLISATFIIFITGSIAESAKVIAGIPPKFLGWRVDALMSVK